VKRFKDDHVFAGDVFEPENASNPGRIISYFRLRSGQKSNENFKITKKGAAPIK